jgi:hypothetical protein
MYGWGGEDDALKIRISSTGKTVYRPQEDKLEVEQKLGEKDTKNIAELVGKYKNEDLLLDEMIWKINGLNSLHYKVLDQKMITNGVFQITVDIA